MTYLRTILIIILLLVVTPAQAQERCRSFPETGYQVCGRLLEYWEQNGGLVVFGFPIGPQIAQQVEGRSLQIQWFERMRLELHPENMRPYDVLLGRLGVDTLVRGGRDWRTFPRGDSSASHYFVETGHAIAPVFWNYWSSHGLEFDGRAGVSFQESLALFGLPLSEAVEEQNPTNGRRYLTQWFERARFEYHPENSGTRYEVLLGLLGTEQGRLVTPPPTSFAQRVIELVNQQRAAAGCTALGTSPILMQVAQAHSEDMAIHDFFAHESQDGRTPFQRMENAGYQYNYAAENIAAGASSPDQVVAMWMDSPGHRDNILNCELRETGVGYVADPDDALKYRTYWTQVFGTR